MLKIELFNDAAVSDNSSEKQTAWIERFTAFARLMPSFFLIGAQKAGTTSLYYHLINHPSIIRPKRKEVFFFNNVVSYNKGISDYKSNFPVYIPWLHARKHTLDATTAYLGSPLCAARIKQHVPNARFIVMLRNPVDRAFSHYKMSVRLGFEKASFSEAVEQENDRIAYGLKNEHNYHLQRLGYVAKGMYAAQLEKWFEVIDRKNFFIIELNEWSAAPAEIFRGLQKFLNIPYYNPDSFKILNESPDEGQMDNEIKQKLSEIFREPNKKLYNLLNVNYNW
jgi:hypothetical protein